MIKEEAGGCFFCLGRGGCCFFFVVFCFFFFACALWHFVKSHWQQPEAKTETSEEAEGLFVFRNAEKWRSDDNMSEQLLGNFCSTVSIQVITGCRLSQTSYLCVW